MEFFSIPLNDPIVLGADLYIYSGTTAPESLVYAEPGAVSHRFDTGLVNQALGPIYSNRTFPMDLELDPGRYFLAFRSWITLEGAPSSKHVAMTTRWTNGDTRALWNFDVLTDGAIVGEWVTMDVFSGFVDNEWAFEIRGRTTADDLSLEGPIPGSAGTVNRIGVRNATPGERVYFFRGSERGEAIVPSCGGLVIEINDPSFVAIETADANGVAS
ncbi:MAG: hypothetical protein ACF8PN_16220 [Phycisphaerales bacterium]